MRRKSARGVSHDCRRVNTFRNEAHSSRPPIDRPTARRQPPPSSHLVARRCLQERRAAASLAVSRAQLSAAARSSCERAKTRVGRTAAAQRVQRAVSEPNVICQASYCAPHQMIIQPTNGVAPIAPAHRLQMFDDRRSKKRLFTNKTNAFANKYAPQPTVNQRSHGSQLQRAAADCSEKEANFARCRRCRCRRARRARARTRVHVKRECGERRHVDAERPSCARACFFGRRPSLFQPALLAARCF